MTRDWTAKGACRVDPALFDDRLDGAFEQDEARSERHALAIGLCLSACPVLGDCRALDARSLGLEGIVAGRLIPSRTTPYTPLPPGDPRHGTPGGYGTHRCRCGGPDGCSAAGRAAERARRERKKVTA